MSIERIGGNNNIQRTSRANKVNKKPVSPVGKDRVDFSSDAKARMEEARQIEMIKSAPDIRQDKVEQARQNLARYMDSSGKIDDAVADKLVENMISSLF